MNWPKVIGSISLFFSVVSTILPMEWATRLNTISLAAVGAANFYYGSKYEPVINANPVVKSDVKS